MGDKGVDPNAGFVNQWVFPELNLSIGKLGTYASLFLVAVSIVLSIVLQQSADSFADFPTDCPPEYADKCKAQSAVLRVSFALAIIFILQIVGTIGYTRFFDHVWIPKILLYIGLVIGFFFTDEDVFNLNGYAWVARILGFCFIIVQSLIVIDVAYSWNEKWLEYSNELNGGEVWKTGLMIVSIALFTLSGISIGVMFEYFSGCPDNDVILSLTVIGPFICTVTQIFYTEDNASLLTSAIMTTYITYICYASITLNPDVECNPTLATKYQTLSTILGLSVTAIGILWTGYTAIQRIPAADSATGTFQLSNIMETTNSPSKPNPYAVAGVKSLFAQVSLVFLFITGYYAMVLTNWSTEQEDSDMRNPNSGKAAMWLQATGQWIAMLMYLWSLVAPKMFPDRDFT